MFSKPREKKPYKFDFETCLKICNEYKNNPSLTVRDICNKYKMAIGTFQNIKKYVERKLKENDQNFRNFQNENKNFPNRKTKNKKQKGSDILVKEAKNYYGEEQYQNITSEKQKAGYMDPINSYSEKSYVNTPRQSNNHINTIERMTESSTKQYPRVDVGDLLKMHGLSEKIK